MRWAWPLAALALSCACLESSFGFCGASPFISASRGGGRPWDDVAVAARRQWTKLQAVSKVSASGGCSVIMGADPESTSRLCDRSCIPVRELSCSCRLCQELPLSIRSCLAPVGPDPRRLCYALAGDLQELQQLAGSDSMAPQASRLVNLGPVPPGELQGEAGLGAGLQ